MVVGKIKTTVVLMISLLPLACFHGKLMREESAKCDAVVLKILEGRQTTDAELPRRVANDGTVFYHLIVRSTSRDILSKYGIEVTSTFAPYYVVWVTKEQIQELLRSPDVQSLQRGTSHNVQEDTK